MQPNGFGYFAGQITAMTYAKLLPVLLVGAIACNNADVPEATADEPAVTAITIEPKTPGTDFPDASITDVAYSNGTFTYAYDAATYRLGEQTPDAGSTMCANSDKGQHIHLIIDNEPYIAKYEPTFEQAIPDGEHYLLSFLSRSYHESIKTPAAHRATVATVANGGIAQMTPIEQPMLFYSRPKGEYVGKDTESILLDFYPVNAPLGAQYKVKVDVGSFSETLDKWQPYLIKGLPMGENTVTLTLVDGEGRTVDAPLNPVSRTFTLVADPMPAQ